MGNLCSRSGVLLLCRDRTGVLFAILDHCNIPLLIYSAGIGDLIKGKKLMLPVALARFPPNVIMLAEVLIQRCSFKNFAEPPLIVANYMKFSDKASVVLGC